MDTRTYMHLSVVCVWCFLNASGLLMVVNAQPEVNAWIVTPEADRKEGGQVEIRCVATNLESDHIVEWRTEDPATTLRWDEHTTSTNQRFEFETTHPGTGQTTQDFTITNLQRDDTDEYFCNVREPIPTGGNIILATSNVTLSVLYFPNESFPICSPDGPITVDIGTELNLQCSSEAGNSAVTMDVNENTPTSYKWTTSEVIDTIMTSSHLTVDILDGNVAFECVISSMYYPGMTRSCIIGPISVNGTSEPITPTGGTPSFTTPLPTTDQTSPSFPWMAAFVVAVILLAVTVIIIIFFIYYVIKLRRLYIIPKEKATNVPTADPYMEQQPHHTYCQTLDVQDECHEYATPEDNN